MCIYIHIQIHIYIYIYVYIYIYIYYIYAYIYIKVNYTVNVIHEKALSNFSKQIKNASALTNYLLRITFSCYLFVLGGFVRFFYDFS